jgi:hypothetical protein
VCAAAECSPSRSRLRCGTRVLQRETADRCSTTCGEDSSRHRGSGYSPARSSTLRAGARTIALDSDTVQALKRHRLQQDKDREEWRNAWVETGRIFTRENGDCSTPPTSHGGSSSCTRRSASRRSDSMTCATVSAHAPLTQSASDEASEAEYIAPQERTPRSAT